MFSELDNTNRSASDHLVAHRGYSQCFPENTVLAIKKALDAGAKYIEIDIQLSADKQAVVFHDRDLTRLCKQPKCIHDYDLNSLRTFSNYSPDRFGDKFKGEKIALLSEVVELLINYPDVILFVELKRISIEKFGIKDMLNAVLPNLEPVISQCVLISFSLDILEAIRFDPSFLKVPIPIGAVIDEWSEALTNQYERLKALDPEYFFCDILTLPKCSDVGKCQLKLLNSKIVTYECTDIEQAVAALERGVGFIETFDIEMMVRAIEQSWDN